MQIASFRIHPRLVLGVAVLVSLLAAVPSTALGQLRFPGPPKKDRNPQKNLTGQVVDKEGRGLAEAVVYLKDKRTLEVKTHISNEKGEYRFSSLDPNSDYEVHAEFRGGASSKRAVSSFDGRTEIYLVLQINPPQRD